MTRGNFKKYAEAGRAARLSQKSGLEKQAMKREKKDLGDLLGGVTEENKHGEFPKRAEAMKRQAPVKQERCSVCAGRGQTLGVEPWWECGACKGTGGKPIPFWERKPPVKMRAIDGYGVMFPDGGVDVFQYKFQAQGAAKDFRGTVVRLYVRSDK